jgi:hypothetical protein
MKQHRDPNEGCRPLGMRFRLTRRADATQLECHMKKQAGRFKSASVSKLAILRNVHQLIVYEIITRIILCLSESRHYTSSNEWNKYFLNAFLSQFPVQQADIPVLRPVCYLSISQYMLLTYLRS